MYKFKILCASLIVLLCGCSKQNRTHDKGYYTEDLTQALDRLYSDSDANLDYYCDLFLKDKKYEIAEQLQKIQFNNDAQKHDAPFDDSSNLKKMGPLLVYNSDKGISKKVEDAWESMAPQGWPLIIQRYEWVKKFNNEEDWLWLNSEVRSILGTDYRRIINYHNSYIDYQDLPLILTLQNKVNDCIESKCTKLDLDDMLLNFAQANPYYNFHLKKLNSADFANYNNTLQNFKNRLSGDIDRFSVRKNPLIKTTNGDTLIVPIDPSVLGASIDKFEDLSSKAWSVDGIKVKIEWKKVSSVGIEILFFDERSYFDFQNLRLAFNKKILDKTITHEFGHVLGLRDRYYEKFNLNTCLYQTRFNRSDIMSDSKNGNIGPTHTRALQKTYNLNQSFISKLIDKIH